MAAGSVAPPPPGFVLDSTPPPPPGFVVDKAAPAPPPGFTLDSAPPQKPQGRGLWQALKDYPAHVAEELVRQFTLPGRVMSGETRLDTPEGMDEAIGLGVGLGMGKLSKVPGGGPKTSLAADRLTAAAQGPKPVEAPPQPPAGGAPPQPPQLPAGAPPQPPQPPQPPAGGAPPQPPQPPQPVTALQAARNAAGTIEKIFSPETVDADARSAAAAIREITGTAARETAKTGASLSPPRAFKFETAYKKVNALPDADRLDFIDYIQGRSTRYQGLSMRDPVLQDLADNIRTAMKRRETRIGALSAHQQTVFVEDYLTQMWKDPHAARQAYAAHAGGGGGKQGSGASFNARTHMSYREGIAAGLEPLTTDPIEITMRYAASMDKFIASEELLETGKNAGMIKYVHPRVVGGTGRPNSFIEPPGWKPLDGRGALRADGARAYAPEGYALVYNNWISKGAYAHEPIGKAYDGLRHVSNMITGTELGLSGYHFLTVGKAAMDNSMSQAVSQLRSGHPIAAAKQFVKTATAPVRYAMSGKQVKDVYLGLSQGSRQLQHEVELLEKAGGRAVGRSHAPDYEFSSKGSYVTAFKRGALRIQHAADRQEAITGGMLGRPFREARYAAKQIGRIMDTVAAPLFDQYIPAVKSGAFRENIANWLKDHPTATTEEQLNAARQIWDDIDDRFGEMVQDNIFMNKIVKQVGMLSLRSWSWTVGQDARMLGGAARDVVRAPFKKPPAGPTPGGGPGAGGPTPGGGPGAGGPPPGGGPGAGGPPRANPGPHDTRWTSKMDMAIAMPIVYGTLAAIYQMWKTHEPPKDIRDLASPRTGGVDAATGEPERLTMPGVEAKDVAGAYMHPTQEATGKIATFPKILFELWNNEDWRGDPIYGNAANAPPWLQQFWDYASQELGPISVRGLAKGKKDGSNVSTMEQIMGVRPAPRYLTDPEGFDEMMKKIQEGKWKRKQSYDRKQQKLYEGD